jgi:hypothetical protein
MIDQLINAFYMTIELWVFLAILGLALIVEPFVVEKPQRPVDNPTLW